VRGANNHGGNLLFDPMNLKPDRIRKTGRPVGVVPGTTIKPKVRRVHPQIEQLKLCLRGLGMEFKEELVFHPVRKWRFDLAVPELKLAIEYQGHGQTGRKKHVGGHASVTGLAGDCEKDFAANVLGWRVLKFTALHFDPKKRAELKLTAPMNAICELVDSIREEQGR
jgi:hypothetical protein